MTLDRALLIGVPSALAVGSAASLLPREISENIDLLLLLLWLPPLIAFGRYLKAGRPGLAMGLGIAFGIASLVCFYLGFILVAGMASVAPAWVLITALIFAASVLGPKTLPRANENSPDAL
jgi:hypothetical protein